MRGFPIDGDGYLNDVGFAFNGYVRAIEYWRKDFKMKLRRIYEG